MTTSGAYQALGLRKELLANIQDFDWVVKAIALGENTGQKTSKRLGAGLAFNQYRPYSQGDDLRRLDWKMYARTNKFYIKESEIETNISVTFVIDPSASMTYAENDWSKLNQAKLAVAVLALLSSRNGDKYGIAGSGIHDPGVIPRNGNKHWQHFLHHLIGLDETRSFSRPNIPKVQEKELFVVLSDLYETNQEWLTFISGLKSKRNEVVVFHLMGEAELHLDFKSTTAFQDLETGKELKFEPKALKKQYQAKLKNWMETLKERFHNEGIDYHLIKIADNVDEVIKKFWWHRKKLN